MPTYEYVCKDCGEGLEVVQSFHDDALTVCPACNGSLRKVFSAAGIIFKGSGWHVKDYASSSSRGGSSDDGSSGDADTSSDASSAGSSTSDTSTSSDGASTSTTSGDKAASGTPTSD